ncbi:hypothetical protein Tco_1185007 [Tanacetum coccineum]
MAKDCSTGTKRPKLEKVDKDQKDGVVALKLEKIAENSGAFESEMAVDLSCSKKSNFTIEGPGFESRFLRMSVGALLAESYWSYFLWGGQWQVPKGTRGQGVPVNSRLFVNLFVSFSFGRKEESDCLRGRGGTGKGMEEDKTNFLFKTEGKGGEYEREGEGKLFIFNFSKIGAYVYVLKLDVRLSMMRSGVCASCMRHNVRSVEGR